MNEIKVLLSSGTKKMYVEIKRELLDVPFRKRLEYQIVLNNCTKRLESLYEYDLLDIDITNNRDLVQFKHREEVKENSKGLTIKDIKDFYEANKTVILNKLQPILVLSNLGKWNLQVANYIDVHKNANRIIVTESGNITVRDVLDSIIDFESPDDEGEIWYDEAFISFQDGIIDRSIYLTNELYLNQLGLHKIINICKFDDLPEMIDDKLFIDKYEEVWADEYAHTGTVVLICEF